MKHSQNKPRRREPYHYDASGAQYIHAPLIALVMDDKRLLRSGNLPVESTQKYSMILFNLKILVIQIPQRAVLLSVVVGDIRPGDRFNDSSILEDKTSKLLVEVIKGYHVLKRDFWEEAVIFPQRQRVRTKAIIVHSLQNVSGIGFICNDKPSFTE